MTGLFASVADLLILNVPGRRAIDETVADWRYEMANARSHTARVVASVRGALAVARVVLNLGVRDLAAGDTWKTTATICGLALVWSGLVVASSLGTAATSHPLLASVALTQGVYLLPGTFVVGLALAALIPMVPRGRQVPIVAVGLLCSGITLANLQFIVPDANQAFRELAAGAATRTAAPDRLRPALGRGVAELSTTDLARRVWRAAPDSAPARRQLLIHGFLVAAPPILLLFSLHVRRLASGRWSYRLSGLGALAAATVAYAAVHKVVGGLEQALSTRGHLNAAMFVGELGSWPFLVVVLMLAIGLNAFGSRTSRPTLE